MQVEDKIKEINYALSYRFSNSDIEKILASKEKFSKGPKNFAMAKTKLLKEKVNAEVQGNSQLVKEIEEKLLELEDRAEQLDKKRVGSLSSISLINDRNRKSNVTRAEQGIREEERRRKMEGNVSDPFTRRKTRPVLSLPKKVEVKEELKEEGDFDGDLLVNNKKVGLDGFLNVKDEKLKKVKEENAGQSSDIFNAHNFDIDINIGGPGLSSGLTSIAVKPVTTSTGSNSGSNKRSLKLEDYKKRKGIL